MPISSENEKRLLQEYVATYLSGELVQEAAEGETDSQLAAAAPVLADRIGHSSEGVIIDIGCGHGPLLSRLQHIGEFIKKAGWLYLAVDTEDKVQEVQRLARQLKLNRRVELVNLDEFYQNWVQISSPQLIFCRNVLHELDIARTSRLLTHISSHFQQLDELIIQDLLRLPSGERYNACWIPGELEACIRAHGFQRVQCTPQPTRSGNYFFTLLAKELAELRITNDDSRARVVEARVRQWKLWSALEQEAHRKVPGRGELVEALDLDLQFAALTRQLRDAGQTTIELDNQTSRRLRAAELSRRIDSFIKGGVFERLPLQEMVRFRERGEQLNILEAFLRSDARLAVIFGGTGIGKTSLGHHLLVNRSYEKFPIVIDCRRTKDIWSFIEQLFGGVGLRLNAEALSIIDSIQWDTVRSSVGQFLNILGSKIIIFLDDFDEILDSNKRIIHDDLSTLLAMIASKEGIKIILASQSEIAPTALLQAIRQAPVMVRVTRFGTDQTVVNILDDHFNRAAAGLGDYPDRLIAAIDRHPLVAVLAGQSLKAHGSKIAFDDDFVNEVRHRLRHQLWNRLVDDTSRPAVEVAANLRVAVPGPMLERLSSAPSVHKAREVELLYPLHDRRWDTLFSLLGVFRLRNVEDVVPSSTEDAGQGDQIDHVIIADLYRDLYRYDDDPKWIRESYYHKILSNLKDTTVISHIVGRYYFPELIASANYAFMPLRDYRTALSLYEAAAQIGNLPEGALMRRAGCLVRIGRRQEGENAYRQLVTEYPQNRGIKTSHIDALLYIQDNAAALAALQGYNMIPADSAWIANQYGRAYLGSDMYSEAEKIFRSLVFSETPEAPHFVSLARTLQQHGALREAIQILERGARRYPNNLAILTSLGVDYERIRRDDEALQILTPIFDRLPDNTRAALAIIRVYIRRGELSDARSVFSRAERRAPAGMLFFVITARAEIWVAEGRPDAAVEFLRAEMSKDDNLVGIFLEAVFQAALNTEDNIKKAELIMLGKEAKVPERLRFNVPLQVIRARVSILARDQALFHGIIQDLKQTKIDPEEIGRLLQQWDEIDVEDNKNFLDHTL